jgi:hypothetical protein
MFGEACGGKMVVDGPGNGHWYWSQDRGRGVYARWRGKSAEWVSTSSLNGAIAGETFSGTYTVSPDCKRHKQEFTNEKIAWFAFHYHREFDSNRFRAVPNDGVVTVSIRPAPTPQTNRSGLNSALSFARFEDLAGHYLGAVSV